MAAPLILGAQAASGGLKVYGQYRRGKISRRVGKLQRREAEATAKQAIALGQRRALEEQRQAELLASRALAVAAAGGGGADDPTVSKIIADIRGEGAYRAALQMYDAEEQSRKLKFEGKMAEFIGKEEYETARMEAIGTLLGTGASMAQTVKYG